MEKQKRSESVLYFMALGAGVTALTATLAGCVINDSGVDDVQQIADSGTPLMKANRDASVPTPDEFLIDALDTMEVVGMSPPDGFSEPDQIRDATPEEPRLPPPVEPSLPNLIRNGDFENDLSSWESVNGKVRIIAGFGVNLSKAARIDPSFRPGEATWDALGQIFFVEPGTTYSIGATASTTAGNGAVIAFDVGYSDGTSTPITIEIGKEFKVYRGSIKTRDKPSWASIQVRHHGGGGVVTVDNVFVHAQK